jgi:hypothetical protein
MYLRQEFERLIAHQQRDFLAIADRTRVRNLAGPDSFR